MAIAIADESRRASDRGEIFKGRQLYARLFAQYQFTEKGEALLANELDSTVHGLHAAVRWVGAVQPL